MKKLLTGLAAAAVAATPVTVTAAEAAVDRSSAPLEGESSVAGVPLIVVLLGAAAIVAGIIIVADDDEDEATSP